MLNKKKTIGHSWYEDWWMKSCIIQTKMHYLLMCKAIIRTIPSAKNQNRWFTLQGNVECFELCEISPLVPCPYCLTYWTEGIVYCTCGTCLVPTELTRKLNGDWFDALKVPNFVIKKGAQHGAPHGKSKTQRGYHQAKQSMRKAHNNRNPRNCG